MGERLGVRPHTKDRELVTIEFDLSTILITAFLSLVSIVSSAIITWYFSRRHYTRTTRPVTENDVVLQQNNNEFKLAAIIMIGFLLVISIMILGAFCGIR